MAKTGQKFDINPETFTLANIFAMELQRYHDTIGEIVTMASKEMGIEKVGRLCYVLQMLEQKMILTERTGKGVFHIAMSMS